MDRPSFGKELFLGRLRLDLLDPLPAESPDSEAEAEAFLARLRTFCEEKVDSRLIELEDLVCDEVINGLKDIGAFAIRLPMEYGGLGLSGVCYLRALMLVSTTHSALGELLAAHQAIGVTQPILWYGTEEQKQEFLPRCVREISAFVPIDQDRPHLTATRHGDDYILDGVKLWTTNGVLADLLLVLAVAEAGVTAFVVPADAPGVTVEQRNSFLGPRGSENGGIRLHQVVVPAANRIGAEGAGNEIATAAQDTGQLSMPAICAAAAKWSLKIAREWSRVRVRWGKPIGEHEAVASKITFIATTAFALEAMVEVSGRHADAGADTGLEAELATLFAANRAWQIADELMQLRGTRGYETTESAAARGERGVPVEQQLRDLRVGRIFDGQYEVLRAFVAATAKGQTTPAARAPRPSELARAYGSLGQHVRFVDRTGRKMARHLDSGEARWGSAVSERHLFLGRVVDIAAELYAMTVCCVYAKDSGTRGPAELANAFCRQARRRIAELTDQLWVNTDDHDRLVAGAVLADEHLWLEEGVLDPSIEGPWIAEPAPGPSQRSNVHRAVPCPGGADG